MKRSGPLKRRKGLDRVSKRRRPALTKAARWRRKYLDEHSWCEIGPVLWSKEQLVWAGRCTLIATELHERIKRSRGGSTTDPENVIPTCRSCHEFTERYPKTATAYGLLASNPDWRQS